MDDFNKEFGNDLNNEPNNEPNSESGSEPNSETGAVPESEPSNAPQSEPGNAPQSEPQTNPPEANPEPQKESGSGTTYYTPPQSEKTEPENTTYHYSYANGSNAGNPDPNSQGYTQQSSQPAGGYNPNSYNAYNQNQTQNQNQNANQNYYSPNNYSQNNNYQNPNNTYSQSQNGNAYSQPQNSGYTQTQTEQSREDSDNKKTKKNKVGIIILIVVIVCVVVAVVGLLAGQRGSSSSDTDSEVETTQESDIDDVETQDSDDVATVDSDGNYTVAGVAEKCMDSCVGVSVYTNQSTSSYSYFYNYGSNDSSDSSESTESSEGSGVIMSEQNGLTYILTCAHVISDGDSFVVTLNDGTEYDATMVAYDSQTDIGVLSIEATGLQVAEFADSDSLVIGEQVVAIGCPGGLEFMNSVTSGYISALDRPISSSIGYDTYCIQTDAAINPGNSGGALFNMQGQVIGINSSKIASTEYEGMGFAIPSSTAISTANSLIKNGYVEGRAKIGIQYTALTNYSNYSSILSALEQLGFEDAEGTMVIGSVDDNSDLKDKDIQEYDMIVAVNGETMTSTDVMTSTLADSSPGDTITLTIARIENNQITTFEVDCELIESTGDN